MKVTKMCFDWSLVESTDSLLELNLTMENHFLSSKVGNSCRKLNLEITIDALAIHSPIKRIMFEKHTKLTVSIVILAHECV